MWSRATRAAAAVVLSLVPLLSPLTGAPAAAQGDPCPEPNDSFQEACYLGPGADAQGFISHPGDIDAYRIEVLDFNTDVHVEMPSMPAAYKAELANWNGDIIASSSSAPNGAEVIDTTVGVPGAYYIFVHSAAGGFSPNRAYVLFRALTYPGSKIPDILFTSEFREGARSAVTGDTDLATYSEVGGRYTIAMKVPGTPRSPSRAWLTNFGPVLTDFTLTVDARIVNAVDGGFQVFFRKNGDDNTDDNTYYATIDVKDGQARLSKKVGGEVTETDWVPTTAINTGGGVNRVVIRCFRDEIRVNVNGEDVIEVSDSSFLQGRIGIGAIAWAAEPPVINFDNIIITTPSEG